MSERAAAGPAVAGAIRNPRVSRNGALFVNFFRRELTTRYLGSVTGLAWALLSPLALLGVYHFVFTHIFRATGFAGESFLAFVAVALWPWLAAQEALQRGAVSLAGYSGMIRKVAFPHELVVLASVTATFALQFAGYLAILAVLRIAGEPIALRGLAVALPVWLILLVAVIGVTFVLAALQVFVKDVEHAFDDAHVPDADPLSADARSGAHACVGRGEPVQLGRRPAARRPARRTRCVAVVGRGGARRRRPAVFRRAVGVPEAVAPFRGFRLRILA
jgi:hypothetical protein